MSLRRASLAYCVFALLFAAVQAGCSTLSESGGLASLYRPSAAPDPGTPTCQIVIRPHQRELEVVEMPLTGGETVQSALQHVRAPKRFRRMEVKVLRNVAAANAGTGSLEKMKCEYSTKRRSVSFETDYALRPGDQVVVIEDTRSDFDKFVERLTGTKR